MKRILALAVAIILLASPFYGEAAEKSLTVGSSRTGEQIILGQIMIALLSDHGFKCRDLTGLGTGQLVRQALINGQIDIYMEYTGAAWKALFKPDGPVPGPEECYQMVKEADRQRHGLAWLPIMASNRAPCLLMSREEAARLKIASISDLAAFIKAHPKELTLGVTAEYYARPEGYQALAGAYGLGFSKDDIHKMDQAIIYHALKEGQVSAGLGLATDGRVEAFDLTVLNDDRRHFPPFYPAPVVRQESLVAWPELEQIFAGLAAKLTQKEMTRLNRLVWLNHQPPTEAARAWLTDQGLIQAAPQGGE